MKRLTLLSLIISGIINSQSKIDFKFYDTCTDSVIKLDYSIKSITYTENHFDIMDNDSVSNIKPGKYNIDVFIMDNEVDYKIFTFTKVFENKKIYNDTIELPIVLKKYRDTSQYGHIYYGFFLCDEICDGYIVDYYKNGVIRLEGNFDNGRPNSEIKKYDSKGKLIEIEIYGTDGFLKEIKYPD
jgi:antitoxin component YwqK of YwqJK toxin-antitoxin module